MALTELQEWIMQELVRQHGRIDGLPTRLGANAEVMELAIKGLVTRRYVTVIGPPNLNGLMGKDVAELYLAPFGQGYLRTRR